MSAIKRTPDGMTRPALWECDDARTSLASATDYRGLGRQDQDQDSVAERVAATAAALPRAASAARESAARLWDEGYRYAVIAERLGVTKGAVAGLLFRHRNLFSDGPIGLEAIERRLRWAVVGQGGCRWVFGTPGLGQLGEGEWHWCGAPLARPGAPYCAEHDQRTRQKG